MPQRPVHGMYFDPCHPRPRTKAMWHGLLLVVSMFAWIGIALVGILVYRWLTGG